MDKGTFWIPLWLSAEYVCRSGLVLKFDEGMALNDPEIFADCNMNWIDKHELLKRLKCDWNHTENLSVPVFPFAWDKLNHFHGNKRLSSTNEDRHVMRSIQIDSRSMKWRNITTVRDSLEPSVKGSVLNIVHATAISFLAMLLGEHEEIILDGKNQLMHDEIHRRNFQLTIHLVVQTSDQRTTNEWKGYGEYKNKKNLLQKFRRNRWRGGEINW